eukprot:m.147378 g.147378  ORF g.147378 m.147378 type:complete len:62 (+) comp16259_c0_seq4:3394-3579(+)
MMSRLALVWGYACARRFANLNSTTPYLSLGTGHHNTWLHQASQLERHGSFFSLTGLGLKDN